MASSKFSKLNQMQLVPSWRILSSVTSKLLMWSQCAGINMIKWSHSALRPLSFHRTTSKSMSRKSSLRELAGLTESELSCQRHRITSRQRATRKKRSALKKTCLCVVIRRSPSQSTFSKSSGSVLKRVCPSFSCTWLSKTMQKFSTMVSLRSCSSNNRMVCRFLALYSCLTCSTPWLPFAI